MDSNTKPFGRTLADALVASGYVRRNSNPDWVRFAIDLRGVSYETLRKAVAQERPPSVKLMRQVAEALHIEPTVFVEYRLSLAQLELDPTRVGWRRAVEALVGWETSRRATDQASKPEFGGQPADNEVRDERA